MDQIRLELHPLIAFYFEGFSLKMSSICEFKAESVMLQKSPRWKG